MILSLNFYKTEELGFTNPNFNSHLWLYKTKLVLKKINVY